MVVSVGPYMFHSERSGSPSFVASSALSASPPTQAFSPGMPSQPDSSSRRQPDGVACIIVTPLLQLVPQQRPVHGRLAPDHLTLAPTISGR